MNLLEEVKKGIEGKYKGLNSGLPRFDKFIGGIQRGTYYVLGAQQKTGKTSFIDQWCLIEPYLKGEENIVWVYFSYEISEIEKKAKIAAYIINKLYNIRTSSSEILSRGHYKITPDLLKVVEEVNEKYIEPLFNGNLHFYEDRENPTGIYNKIMDVARKYGEFKYETYMSNEGVKRKPVGYVPKDKNLYFIIVIDHVGLVNLERGYTKKENIDKLSSYMVILRNRFNFTPIVVSQFNRGLSKTDRLKFNGNLLKPTAEDFKDTGSLSEDASMLLALFNPTKYPHITTFLGKNVKEVGKGYRSLHIIDSRFTESDIDIRLEFDGLTGTFSEI
jgi:KaiC/GvpD/RAD55 family RecA-like ATPase